MPTGTALEDWAKASPSLADLAVDATRAAQVLSPLLILGAPGTGRSSLARAVHAASERRALVEVDPGNVPTSLFDAELFGHAAGAFTGAHRASEGKLGRAQGGSLVFDHVEEMPLSAQAKLLRVLSEGRYSPLGGAETSADVRFMAIGPGDLKRRVASGQFREDLYFRLEVLMLRLPSLAERKEDLPFLIDHHLADLASRFKRPGLCLAPEALDWMLDYDWPGNLREMRNLLERQLIVNSGTVVNPPAPERGGSRPLPLAQVEAREIRRALAYTRGHQQQAAELLGISRKTLWEKRKRYGLH